MECDHVFKEEGFYISLKNKHYLTIGNLEGKELGVGASLWFAVDEKIEDLQTQLAEKKVTILGSINVTPFGKTLLVKDPDGYIITFLQTY